MASSLEKLGNNLSDTSDIKSDKCNDNMELVNISNKRIALLGCEQYKIKKCKYLDEKVLKKSLWLWWTFWLHTERCISVWVHGKLGEICRDKATTKECILKQAEHERYQWYWLWTRTAGLE